MARGDVFTEHGTFWFEGHVFRDPELPPEPLIERLHTQRIDDEPQYTYREGISPPDPEREARVQAHADRVAVEEPLAEEIIDWPPTGIR